MLDALPFPPQPNLEQYKKQAKELLKACKSADPQALPAWLTQWTEAQLRIDPAQASARRPYAPGEIARRVRDGVERVTKHLGVTDAASRGACTLTRAQFALAREFGFASWPQFARHVEALARARSSIGAFEAAVDAIVSGDLPTLERLLAEHPALATARSTREHEATLLHYVSANGVEDYRQKTPPNIVPIAALLLRAGADVNAESIAYGGRSTTLGLTATSYHPQAAGVQLELLALLLEHGATIDSSDGGSAVNGCLRNGRGQAADFLASRGARLDLEGASGVGRLDVVKTFFDPTGRRKSTATQSQMNAGFAWACEFGRTEVAAFLLQNGMDADATLTQRGETGLHWAAYGAHVEIARLLLERVTRVDIKDQAHQSTPLEWAVFAWSNSGESKRFDYYKVVAMLTRAGAIPDPKWYETASNRQSAAKKIQSDPHMLAALRGELLPP
ncbi:MAG TPA: ankyrin repeat domain-containing protein [Tepidisphaeraceae bacterium]|jgi:ankyrin repeat protein